MEKYHLSRLRDRNFSKVSNEIYLITDFNKKQYPEYYKWFYGKNIPRIINGNGEAILYLDALEIIGLSILKKDEEESKICTLLINEEYRKKGYSSLILEDSFSFLKTDKPLITIPLNRIDEFQSIIDFYGWKQSDITDCYYTKEAIFNGPTLIKK